METGGTEALVPLLAVAGLAQGKGRSGLAWWAVSLLLGPFATFSPTSVVPRLTAAKNQSDGISHRLPSIRTGSGRASAVPAFHGAQLPGRQREFRGGLRTGVQPGPGPFTVMRIQALRAGSDMPRQSREWSFCANAGSCNSPLQLAPFIRRSLSLTGKVVRSCGRPGRGVVRSVRRRR
jgi:hypothetical protein